MSDTPVQDAAKAACEAGYMDNFLNQRLAMAVHNAFAEGKLHEGETEIQRAVRACSQYGRERDQD